MNIYVVGAVDDPLSEKNDDADATVIDDPVDTNKNANLDDVGVDDEYLPKKNNYSHATVNDDTIEKNKNENIYYVVFLQTIFIMMPRLMMIPLTTMKMIILMI